MAVNPSEQGHRARQAAETRRQVAEAARRLFTDRGYVATTISAISAEADIPAQTIYSAFGSKARILAEVKDRWVVASEAPQQHIEALRQPDPVRRLRMAAHWHRRQMELGHDVVRVYTEAARVDPGVAQEWAAVRAGRERAVRALVASLGEARRPGLSTDRAVDVYVACTLAETWSALVLERGWTAEEFERWTADLLVRELLGGGSAP